MTSETALRRIRQRIFDYPPHKEDQADRVLQYLKARMLRYREKYKPARGPYSGMTRLELAQSRTCEPDWY